MDNSICQIVNLKAQCVVQRGQVHKDRAQIGHPNSSQPTLRTKELRIQGLTMIQYVKKKLSFCQTGLIIIKVIISRYLFIYVLSPTISRIHYGNLIGEVTMLGQVVPVKFKKVHNHWVTKNHLN